VLVVSRFAGAARELTDALIVNPYDIDGTADALLAALAMARDEQRERMRALRAVVSAHNVYAWAGRMLIDAARSRHREAVRERLVARRPRVASVASI
jgi:trehalose 6-phosphate synthase